MIIKGSLVTVMESWPLQLSVRTRTGRYHVQLLETTTVTQQGETIVPGDLRPGQQIRVEGQASGSMAMTAQTIEILSRGR